MPTRTHAKFMLLILEIFLRPKFTGSAVWLFIIRRPDRKLCRLCQFVSFLLAPRSPLPPLPSVFLRPLRVCLHLKWKALLKAGNFIVQCIVVQFDYSIRSFVSFDEQSRVASLLERRVRNIVLETGF